MGMYTVHPLLVILTVLKLRKKKTPMHHNIVYLNAICKTLDELVVEVVDILKVNAYLLWRILECWL